MISDNNKTNQQLDKVAQKSDLEVLLHSFRTVALSEREKGTYFEELILTYFKNEATYKDLYDTVWHYSDWAREQGLDARDVGIDLVAKTNGTNEYHAIQCKFYAENYKVQKSDIDSFFTASGQKPFSHRIIVTTTNNWSEHAESALQNQNPPVNKIDLFALENSQIDWSKYAEKKKVILKEKKKLRDHQKSALKFVKEGLQKADRGKLIMACGTGKTFTSLKIAEEIAGKGKRVLFLVPSLSLLSQTLTEWTQESAIPLHSFAVCSDSEVGKKRNKDEDVVATFAHELRFPATTEPTRLATELKKRHDDNHMSVVFSTYHSIDVISQAQHKYKLENFDLIICDEAHRTTGATFEDEEESNFVKVHDAKFIRANKRLYMTATPRIYGEIAKVSAEKDNVALASMDDESLFGKELFVITFSEAVNQKLLVDYKVIVLAVDENHISSRLQDLLADDDNHIKVDDAAKIIGCWKALSKQDTTENLTDDLEPMKRAVAFCQVIEYQKNSKTHKVSSKTIAKMFQEVVEAYQRRDRSRPFLENENALSDTENEFPTDNLHCEAEHVDGSMNATTKESKINWLKANTSENVCRILSNVRCLSEGVDVPALDAVLFLTPRNSQVDVVQSVGRVMRNAPGKKRGYVILPVVIPAGIEPHIALNDNKTYKVVWLVLQALRSHDDRFDAMINKLDLIGADKSKMEVIAVTDKIAKKTKSGKSNVETHGGASLIGRRTDRRKDAINRVSTGADNQPQLKFDIGEIEIAIYAKVVQKCGNRQHWEDWANDIAKIANTHIGRIKAILGKKENTKEIKAFEDFAEELRDDLNDSITNEEVIEMLAQHLVTKPVFDALFSKYEFTKLNAVSRAMDAVLAILEKHNIQKEADTLQRFYESVKMRAEGIENAEGKQKIILELYDKFFRNAFPRLTERLGIVYTPVEAVDFIIHSVNDILKQEFGITIGSEQVQVLDPFTGTGTFITRLMQSGLLTREELIKKYKTSIHANEIVLLAYYIAAINIESTYHDMVGQASLPVPVIPKKSDDIGVETGDIEVKTGDIEVKTGLKPVSTITLGNPTDNEYHPFEGILLTDTFQLYEKDDLISRMLVDNSERRKRQKALDIRVIICNPPYSAKQESANDNNQNIVYPALDERISKTYAKDSAATNKNALYDSYIRAIRWASDRLGDSGIMGFITNAGFIEGNAMDGLRKCLAEEFTNIYVFHLRGNARTSGEQRRKEKDNVFGQGTRTPIAITLFVKNPNSKKKGQIYFHDIGDYLTQKEKLDRIRDYKSIQGITERKGWTTITPDAHNDWINQRDDSFGEFISLGDKKDKSSVVLFENYSRGLETNRDAWCYNSSSKVLATNIQNMIDFYNQEVERYQKACKGKSKEQFPKVDDFINNDPTKISWHRGLKSDVAKNKKFTFQKQDIVSSVYRPFQKQWVYFNRNVNAYVNKLPQIFPNPNSENRVMYLNGSGNSGKDFSVLMVDVIPDLNMQHSGGQGFPLYLYDDANAANAADGRDRSNSDDADNGLFATKSDDVGHLGVETGLKPVSTSTLDNSTDVKNPSTAQSLSEKPSSTNSPLTIKKRHALTNAGLSHFQNAYPNETITKEDIFYYIYGLLHSPTYREKYADNLSKELPRIPCVKRVEDFWAFSKAGRKLADIHCNYENAELYPVTVETGLKPVSTTKMSDEKLYHVTQMKYISTDVGTGRDLSLHRSLRYNEFITITDIPSEAFEYIVNGKPALDWIVERYSVSTHKESGIVNDANLWGIETAKNPKYPLELFQRVITVSLETMEIVKGLPEFVV